jgi:hypothetical protein
VLLALEGVRRRKLTRITPLLVMIWLSLFVLARKRMTISPDVFVTREKVPALGLVFVVTAIAVSVPYCGL